MSELYSTLEVSPRKKKRTATQPDADAYTPKKLRTAYALIAITHTLAHGQSPITPPSTVSQKARKSDGIELPRHLTHLLALHTSLQNALSHALATCAVSPSGTGVVRNILNHLSLKTYTGLNNFVLDDLRRLCWLWEWDATSLNVKSHTKDTEEDNPFLDDTPAKDWSRSAMGIVVSPAMHKAGGTRCQAYGLGIEVEMDIDKDMSGGMAAVARWTGASESRTKEFHQKLFKWAELNSDISPVPHIPLAQLPTLRSLTSPFKSKLPTPSPSQSPFKSPTKRTISSFAVPFPSTPSRSTSPTKRANSSFAVPFPSTPSRSMSPTKNSILFPSTSDVDNSLPDPLTPRTPSTSNASTSVASTPVRQRVSSNSSSVPQTPTSARRQALYERIRQRSLTASPTKGSSIMDERLTRDQMLKLSQEETRRRCLLGRLAGVAESVWMLFSAPVTGSVSSSTTRKRRALPMSEVAHAIVKSSPVPISIAEANESIGMLIQLCPFFLKQLNIGGEEWLEMPAASSNRHDAESDGAASPVKGKDDSAQEILTRSPKRVRREEGGLRAVREIIRRELESQD